MDITEIRESGLLELYALRQCSLAEQELVEKAIETFPELKNELYHIGAALENYARLHEISPSADLKRKILEEARQIEPSSRNPLTVKNKNRSFTNVKRISILLGLSSLLLGYLYFDSNRTNHLIQKRFDDYQIICDSLQLNANIQFALLNQLQDPNNEVFPVVATTGFSETELYLIYNSESRQNFVQIKNLPNINEQQSFQLWSLKSGVAPIPLTVFQGDEGFIIPVDFEEGTATYAITIEAFGGVQSPTLSNLIGTVNVPV